MKWTYCYDFNRKEYIKDKLPKGDITVEYSVKDKDYLFVEIGYYSGKEWCILEGRRLNYLYSNVIVYAWRGRPAPAPLLEEADE